MNAVQRECKVCQARLWSEDEPAVPSARIGMHAQMTIRQRAKKDVGVATMPFKAKPVAPFSLRSIAGESIRRSGNWSNEDMVRWMQVGGGKCADLVVDLDRGEREGRKLLDYLQELRRWMAYARPRIP